MTNFTARILTALETSTTHKTCPFSCKICVLCGNYASLECADIVADIKAERDGAIKDY
jgi:hypothetical protein